MFVINLNEDKTRIQVKTNAEQNSQIIAEGHVAADVPDHTVLILFDQIALLPDDHQQIDQLLSTVSSYVSAIYHSLICIRFPRTFDNQIPFDKLEYRNECPDFMSVNTDDLKYYPENNFQGRQDQYELVSDRNIILGYAEQLLQLMTREAFWSETWNLQEMCDRINSATNNAMILDKINHIPCAFGRLFLVESSNEQFGYMSDIAVDSAQQSKGLGRVLVNYLVGVVYNSEKRNSTLCLQCAKEGSGAISATKLYRRSGFEFFHIHGNRIAIFPKKKVASGQRSA
ncbi:unnamed protein product [Adineta ricciae]|uniref:N-acetyltransferase domain-containing protein n=1 Tax=Adineta ricciae TaxID=249248 RepID=A0A813T2M7_ADIRI|nr:unnamed protein product [Adineta ricciae]CAF0812755.1 unnamed protein product [Adineta ricciae]